MEQPQLRLENIEGTPIGELQLDGFKLVFRRVVGFDINHQRGLDKLPLALVKVKAGNGYIWISITVAKDHVAKPAWSREVYDSIQLAIQVAANILVPGDIKICTDLDRTIAVIKNYFYDEQRDVMYGNNGNAFMDCRSENNIEINITRGGTPVNIRSYGGVAIPISVGDERMIAFVYHRDAIITNYADIDAIKTHMFKHLCQAFGSFFKFTIEEEEPSILARTRRFAKAST